MSALAVRTGAVNLGQGFPDTDGPPEMLDAAAAALRGGRNQYPPGPGIPELRAAIAAHQRRFWDLDYDPDGEVLVTAGATEAIAASLLALCEPGDEVVCFEPYYDSYAACDRAGRRGPPAGDAAARARTAGTASTRTSCAPPSRPRTRVVLLNSPHNPTGKVFTRAELTLIAELCQEYDAVAVTDEVYEHLVFTDAAGPHVPLATLPGMRERTLRISSAGKTFSCTGWKIGWVSGPRRAGLRGAAGQAVPDVRQRRPVPAGRDRRARTVRRVLRRLPGRPAGQARPAGRRADRGRLRRAARRRAPTSSPPTSPRWAARTGSSSASPCPSACGVVAVPTQVFYDTVEAGRHLVRFAFCKRPEVLAEAVTRLRALAVLDAIDHEVGRHDRRDHGPIVMIAPTGDVMRRRPS